MRRLIMPGVAMLALIGPASACSFSATDFRSIFDHSIAPTLGLQPVSEYSCQTENGAAFCNLNSPENVNFIIEDAPEVKRASLVMMNGGDISPATARTIIEKLAALCSPEVDPVFRREALESAAAAPKNGLEGFRIIIGDVSYRLIGDRSVRIKDRRLPNTRGVNTSDDE